MPTRPVAPLTILAAMLILATGCQGQGGAAAGGPSSSPRVDLVEASGLCIVAESKVAVVGGDETRACLWGVSLDDPAKRWALPFPLDMPTLDDIEALAPWGKYELLVCCSQSRTKPHARVRPERNRLALVTLSPDGRQITAARVYDGLRDHLLGYLAGQASRLVENTAAIADGTPATGGLNVEGLAAWQGQLLVGLRSPIARNGAIVIPIKNPQPLFATAGSRTPPEFGPLLILPTEPGEGIRDMAATDDGILLILGPSAEVHRTKPRIVRWDPAKNELKKVHVPGFKKIQKPEGMAVDPQGRLLIVQDQLPPLPEVLFRLEIKDKADEE